MSAVLVQLADGLAAEINAHDFDTEFDFEAERSWNDLDANLEEMEPKLLVEVVPSGHSLAEIQDRESCHYHSAAFVGIRYKFPRTDTAQGTGKIDQGSIDGL